MPERCSQRSGVLSLKHQNIDTCLPEKPPDGRAGDSLGIVNATLFSESLIRLATVRQCRRAFSNALALESGFTVSGLRASCWHMLPEKRILRRR
jgi:hypothetical protein